MIEIPAVWLRYGFTLLEAFLLLLALAHLANGIRHGFRMTLTVLSSGFYVAGLAAIIYTTWTMLGQVDWTGSFSIALPSFDFIRFGS